MATLSEDVLSRSLKRTRGGIAAAIFFSFFINLLAFVTPLYMLQIYDRVITSRNVATLVALTAIAIFLLVVCAVLEKVRLEIFHRLGLLFDANVRAPLFNAVMRGTLLNPEGGHGHALRDLDTIREFLTGAGPLSFCDVPWMPIFIAGCFMLNVWFGAIATFGAVAIFAFAIANEAVTKSPLKAASHAAVATVSYASAILRNSEVLHAMGMLAPLRERWLVGYQGVLMLQAQAGSRSSICISSAKILRALLQVAILGTGGYLAIEQQTSPVAMIAASIIMARALAPVEMAVTNWSKFLGARSAYGRIAALMTVVPEEPARMRLPTPRGELAVDEVSAIPPGASKPALRSISFCLRPGELLGIIGPSAAGKSTLARVLVGVWPTSEGQVRIDGAELGHWDPEQLAPWIGYLPQDVELFPGTIADNIARFGLLDDEQIIEAAMLAGVHDMVQALPDGYNTQIGDSGCMLSGGQRQRIGLARALYGKPALIVLDEPNASLDCEGETALMNALDRLRELGRTVIVVTHKTSILSEADKILVLDRGQIQAFGVRDDVLPKPTGRIAQIAPTPIALVR